MSQLQAVVDQLLTDVSSGYFPSNYISESIFPDVKVAQKTGKLGKYGTSHLRIENSIIAGRGKYRRVEAVVRQTSTFSIDGHGLEGIVTEDDYANVQKPFDAEADETLGLTAMLALEKEFVLASALSDTAVLSQNVTLSGTAQLNDFGNSTPVADFATARSTIMGSTGMAPNVAIMSWAVKNVLMFHPQLMDYLGFKYNRTGGLSDDELAKALGVEKVLIGSAVYESAKEGQTSSLAQVWGKNIIFAVSPAAAQVRQVALGYLLGMQGKSPRQVYKWPGQNPPGSTKILVEDQYQFLISNANAGYLIKNAIA